MKKAFIITVSILSCFVLVLGLTLFATRQNLTSTSANLESMYQRSLYELVNNVNNMEVEVSKLLVSNDATSQQRILSNIKQQTGEAENSISLLPINSDMVFETSKFMNKLNGYCTSLINYNDAKISDNDLSTIEQIYEYINNIKIELNKIIDKVMQGYRISENLGSDTEIGDFSESFKNILSDTIAFPSLIYDGPFSDSTINKTIKGLKDFEITSDEAQEFVKEIFSSEENLTYLGETKGRFETFDFVLEQNGQKYYVQVTKKGKFLLTLSSNYVSKVQESTSDKVTTDDVEENEDYAQDDVKKAIEVAKDFAKKLGIENMESVWSAKSDNAVYINLAPVEDNIVFYPDLIKAKVDLNTQTLIGWEASSYAYNHVEREDLIENITIDEARALVSKNLKIDNQRLCVIPLDYVGEVLAYEFSGEYNGYRYYLYLDANTGSQVRVLRVVQTSQGELVL